MDMLSASHPFSRRINPGMMTGELDKHVSFYKKL